MSPFGANGTRWENQIPVQESVPGVSPFPPMPGVVVRCRPIGMLKMTDEAGGDTKLLAVPIDRLTPLYRDIETPRDLPRLIEEHH